MTHHEHSHEHSHNDGSAPHTHEHVKGEHHGTELKKNNTPITFFPFSDIFYYDLLILLYLEQHSLDLSIYLHHYRLLLVMNHMVLLQSHIHFSNNIYIFHKTIYFVQLNPMNPLDHCNISEFKSNITNSFLFFV